MSAGSAPALKRSALPLAGIAAATVLSGCVLPGSSLYMDGRPNVLDTRLAAAGFGVTRREDLTTLSAPPMVLFDVDRAELRPEADAAIGLLARAILAEGVATVTVAGHADDTGDNAYNQALSERRAQAVTQALAAHGVPLSLISASGLGERVPAASNASPEGRARNRRVEVTLPGADRPAAFLD